MQAACRSCKNRLKREKYAASEQFRDNVRDDQYRRLYGASRSELEQMLDDQGRACAICTVALPVLHRANVDHDHATGQIRGILCHKCNVGLGQLGDTATALRKALAYLER